MPHIKKLVMHGFKSFARKTEIPLENSMNVIVGPNGSGKSNITDALCFVLGRLSIKSIRAAKAANLLFSGTRMYKGSQEAFVELVFDNEDKVFAMDSEEVSIKRVVRRNGQSTYKINGQTKTRQELLELLAQAGIDPNGFNIVLQGEIASMIKATAEDRRKIIEEVAGISIYETRKHKSLRELEKTEEKLKEVSAILKERGSYLKNLDRERQEAMSYQKLEETIKKCKATILHRGVKEKEKEVWGINKLVENNDGEIEKIRRKIKEKSNGVEEFQLKIVEINKTIQSSTSNEQENLHKEISNLKADLAGVSVRKENFESRLEQGKEKVSSTKGKIKILSEDLSKIQSASPEIKEQQEQQKSLQGRFDLLEQQRRKFYIIKSELSTLENQKEEREKSLIESKKELQLIEQNISSLFEEIKYAKSLDKAETLKKDTNDKIHTTEEEISKQEEEILKEERRNAILEQDIKREGKLREEITNLETCPTCKQTVKEEYKEDISQTSNRKISFARQEIERVGEKREDLSKRKEEFEENLNRLKSKLNDLGIDLLKIKNAEEKKEQIKRISEQEEETKLSLSEISSKITSLRVEFEKLKGIEERYDETRLRLQELSFSEIDVDTEVSIKKRELNRLNVELKATGRDIEESEQELKKLTLQLEEKEKVVEKKEIEEQKLYEKFQELFNKRNELQDQQKVFETDIIGFQHTTRNFEDKNHHNNVQKAQYTAQIDALKTEIAEFGNVEFLSFPIEQIKERLQKSQFRISRLGNVNLRALEVFDKVQEQVESIQKKVETIEKEKEKVEKIITEIDRKKKKAFVKTLEAVNEYFTRNFSQLSKKGEVSLELENKKDPFDGGLNIIVKVSRGKYFDITSLSGGEKTMVSLALIFAIQEYKPYCFYIFDEIDAALDKRNSELLAALIKKYMTTGQYIIVTHNDTLITEASSLYGVSMQENISKVISLKI
jgi:chromosome segregation protein